MSPPLLLRMKGQRAQTIGEYKSADFIAYNKNFKALNVIFAFIGANRFHFISTCEIAKRSTYCKLLMRRKMLTSQFENLKNAG